MRARWWSSVVAAVMVGAWATGCSGASDAAGDGDGDEIASTDEADQALTASKGFNHAGQGHDLQCVRPKAGLSSVALYYADGTATGYYVPTSELRHTGASRCRTGELQLDPREAIASPRGTLYLHRGGYGYEHPTLVKYGFVRLGDLEARPRVVKSDAGNGEPCAFEKKLGTDGKYAITVRALPDDFHYWKSDRSAVDGYGSYGDPGGTQGVTNGAFPYGPVAHYNYLVWSWPNVGYGGVVRSLLPDGAVFHRCAVKALRVATVDAGGKRNGWIEAVYGGTYTGRQWLYGWTTYAHQHDGDAAPTVHMRPL